MAPSDRTASSALARQSTSGADHPGRAPPDLRARSARSPASTRQRSTSSAATTGSRPKVIASTATIRRADGRRRPCSPARCGSSRRPASTRATRASPSRRSADDKGTRLYVGVMAPGASQTTLMIRTYAALLQSAARARRRDPDVKDPYWTLVGYFNSLRVLGGARMQVQDDVNDRLELLARRRRATRDSIEQRIELTSRESSGEIPEHLERMEIAAPGRRGARRHPRHEHDLGRRRHRPARSDGGDGAAAVDLRVHPGDEPRRSTLPRPRRRRCSTRRVRATDRTTRRSASYHSALYRQVESTSVTPFSPRARDRALHAVLDRSRPAHRSRASRTTRAQPTSRRTSGPVELLKRADPRACPSGRYPDEVDGDRRRARRDRRALAPPGADAPTSCLSQPFKLDKPCSSTPPRAALEDGTLPTLWSLRDVDQESNLFLVN